MRVTSELAFAALFFAVTGCVTPGPGSPANAGAKPCQPFTDTTLQDLQRQPHPTTVVFFASWCVSCRDAIVQPRAGHAILVGTFDETENLERVYASSGATLPCFIDHGVASRRFGVTSLPFETTFDKTLSL